MSTLGERFESFRYRFGALFAGFTHPGARFVPACSLDINPYEAAAPPRYRRGMVILVVVLLALWLILAIIGFAIKGLIWIAVIGIVLFIATGLIGALRRRTSRSRRTEL